MLRWGGMGADPGAFSTQCGGGLDALNYDCWPQIAVLNWFNPGSPKVVAPPKPPANLTLPPASGTEAEQTVTDLVNQQLEDQKALNATKVQSSTWDEILGGAAEAGDAAQEGLKSAVNWLPWLLGGLGVFAIVALSGGSPRRYGR